MADELPILGFATQDAFEQWLETNHSTAKGLWLKIAKKASGIPSVFYEEALDAALCFGWIDGQKRPYDDDHWLQRFTPRKAHSRWSQRNCDKVDALIISGAMRAAGLREVKEARADGRWSAAYSGQRTATVPDDLAEALAANPAAEVFFATLDSTNRYAFLYRLGTAKRTETRARRIEQYVTMLAEHRKIYN